MKILPLIETMLLPSSEIFLKLINRHPLQGKGGGNCTIFFRTASTLPCMYVKVIKDEVIILQ